jgi:hypothetical protein
MPHTFLKNLLCILTIACIAMLFVSPVYAFTANSLDITIDKSGDATASFTFTLGFFRKCHPPVHAGRRTYKRAYH